MPHSSKPSRWGYKDVDLKLLSEELIRYGLYTSKTSAQNASCQASECCEKLCSRLPSKKSWEVYSGERKNRGDFDRNCIVQGKPGREQICSCRKGSNLHLMCVHKLATYIKTQKSLRKLPPVYFSAEFQGRDQVLPQSEFEKRLLVNTEQKKFKNSNQKRYSNFENRKINNNYNNENVTIQNSRPKYNYNKLNTFVNKNSPNLKPPPQKNTNRPNQNTKQTQNDFNKNRRQRKNQNSTKNQNKNSTKNQNKNSNKNSNKNKKMSKKIQNLNKKSENDENFIELSLKSKINQIDNFNEKEVKKDEPLIDESFLEEKSNFSPKNEIDENEKNAKNKKEEKINNELNFDEEILDVFLKQNSPKIENNSPKIENLEKIEKKSPKIENLEKNLEKIEKKSPKIENISPKIEKLVNFDQNEEKIDKNEDKINKKNVENVKNKSSDSEGFWSKIDRFCPEEKSIKRKPKLNVNENTSLSEQLLKNKTKIKQLQDEIDFLTKENGQLLEENEFLKENVVILKQKMAALRKKLNANKPYCRSSSLPSFFVKAETESDYKIYDDFDK